MANLIWSVLPGKGNPGQPSFGFVPGMMTDAGESALFKNLEAVGTELGLEVITCKDEANMGLGTPEALKNLKFSDLVQNAKAIVAKASQKVILIPHSLGFVPALEAAKDPILGNKVCGILCLAPAPTDVVVNQYNEAMKTLQKRSDEGHEESTEKLRVMQEGKEVVYIAIEENGYPFPFFQDFVTSTFPFKINMDKEIPISQPTTIIHGKQDKRVKIESSKAIYANLPPTTSANFIERGSLGHDFSGIEAFETVRDELVKLVDQVTPNLAETIYDDGYNPVHDFSMMKKDRWVIHEMAASSGYTRFRFRDRKTNKIYPTKFAAQEATAAE